MPSACPASHRSPLQTPPAPTPPPDHRRPTSPRTCTAQSQKWHSHPYHGIYLRILPTVIIPANVKSLYDQVLTHGLFGQRHIDLPYHVVPFLQFVRPSDDSH